MHVLHTTSFSMFSTVIHWTETIGQTKHVITHDSINHHEKYAVRLMKYAKHVFAQTL